MIEAIEHKRLVALLFLNLDGFKVINDTLAHEAGDRLFKEVDDSLTKCARLGGDEFTTIPADMAHSTTRPWSPKKILETFSRPFSIDDKELVVTASIGIALYPFDDEISMI
jgi:diguanylate cyclase (GGDEF)-like protein